MDSLKTLDADLLLRMYHDMVMIRAFEENLAALFEKGLLGGTSHFCIGQEATAVGVVQALSDGDWLISNHRGHGHLLARGLDPAKVLGELMGRVTGYCKGRGGSQHLSAIDRHFLGTNGITGGGIPIAAGAALACQYQQTGEIAVAFFGDGASNQGTFHETLNMSSIWRLPVLFVCENNLYAMSTPTSRTVASGTIAPRAAAYNMRGTVADGLDVEAVFTATQEAAARVRNGEGPELLELMTYRQCGHSKRDQRVYRTREEEAEYAKRDPILTLRQRLLELGCSENALANQEAAAHNTIAQATQDALAAPAGGPQEALTGLFAQGDLTNG